MHSGKWALVVEAALRLHLKLGSLYCPSKTHKLSGFTVPHLWCGYRNTSKPLKPDASEKCSLHLSDASVESRWTWPCARPTPIAGTLPPRWPSDDSFGLRWSRPGDRSRPPLCGQWPTEWCRGRCVPSPPGSCRARKIPPLLSSSVSFSSDSDLMPALNT